MEVTIINTIISATSIVVTAIVGIVLRNQIKSQKAIMDGYKNYFEILDIKKIKELHEYHWELKTKAISTTIDAKFDDFAKDVAKEFDELTQFATRVVNSLPEEIQQEFINENFPLCKSGFRRTNDDKHNVGE